MVTVLMFDSEVLDTFVKREPKGLITVEVVDRDGTRVRVWLTVAAAALLEQQLLDELVPFAGEPVGRRSELGGELDQELGER